MTSSMLHHNELINIEEDTILGHRSMVRRFTLHNRANHLMVSILTSGAALSSVKVENGKQEIISSPKEVEGQQPQQPQQPQPFEWQSHVLGLDTLLLAANSSTTQSVMYQLTTDNELIVTGKVKGHLQLMAPYFFNLKSVSASGPSTLDGHLLHIKSSGSCNDIGEPGPLLQANGDVPFDLIGPTPCPLTSSSLVDSGKAVYDTVYSCLGDMDTAIIATLRFETRVVEVSLQPNNNSQGTPCRLRVRIRKDGVSLIPTHMNEFRCVFKFIW